MMLRMLEMDLTPDSIAKTLEQVKTLQKRTEEMLDAMSDDLLTTGVSEAKKNMTTMGIPDGPLYQSVQRTDFNKESHSGFITAGEGLVDGHGEQSYAVHVEWGTGKVAAEAQKRLEKSTAVWSPTLKLPAKKKEEPEQTDSRYTSKDTWVYCIGEKDRWYTTSGYAPRPFMHNTYTRLRELAKANAIHYVMKYLMGK